MKAFIEYVVKALVDHPEQVDVKEVDGERVVVFEVRLNPTDIGKVIGKSGRMISSLRTLCKAAGEKDGLFINLELFDEDEKKAEA